ncbi:TlpA family protein disulfide reductase [Peribacillus tepidiphilus]|uniref:TlpA family protein disulfide reductase n=1 Tax=Peribacillus tepidiphilus TaxID=2652445 RepID=UPI0035B56DD7
MNKITKMITIMLLIIGIVGCNQDEKTKSKDETKHVEPASTESQESSEEEVINKLVGNWSNDEVYMTIVKDNDNLIMKLGSEDKYWNITIEVQEAKDSEVQGLVINSDMEQEIIGTKFTYVIKDENRLDIFDNSHNNPLSLMKATEDRASWEREKAIAEKELDIVFENSDGTIIDFKDFRGKKVVLLMWGSWAKPAVETLNNLNDIYEDLRKRDIVVYNISYDINEEDFIKENNIRIPYLHDENGEFEAWLGSLAIPTLYIYDEDGLRIDKIVGSIDKEEMKKRILGE